MRRSEKIPGFKPKIEVFQLGSKLEAMAEAATAHLEKHNDSFKEPLAEFVSRIKKTDDDWKIVRWGLEQKGIYLIDKEMLLRKDSGTMGLSMKELIQVPSKYKNMVTISWDFEKNKPVVGPKFKSEQEVFDFMKKSFEQEYKKSPSASTSSAKASGTGASHSGARGSDL